MSESARTCPAEEVQSPSIQLVEARAPLPPLRWNGFLAYFFLWCAAAMNLVRAVWLFSGRAYFDEATRDALYAALPAMRVIDLVYVASMVISALILLWSRFGLARKKRWGVKRMQLGFALALAGTIFYGVARCICAGISPLSAPLLSRGGVLILLLCVNHVYYGRRRDVFVSAQGGQK